MSAKGWSEGEAPAAADGLDVGVFARGLDHPRWLYVLPNGDVLVAKAGGTVPSANRITLLRDADGDGFAETRSVLLTDLRSPFGMALVGNDLYIANTDELVKVPYRAGTTRIAEWVAISSPTT